MSMTIIVIGAVVILVSVLLLAFVFMKSNQVNLTGKTEDKPEWMQSLPPQETVAATKARGAGIGLYSHDAGEQLAAPFAEQLEDILRAKLEAHPELKNIKIDLGTGEGLNLDIWVDGKKYTAVDDLPSEHLKQVFREAIQAWESHK